MGFVYMESFASLLILMKSLIGRGGCGTKNGSEADGLRMLILMKTSRTVYMTYVLRQKDLVLFTPL